MPSNNAAPPVWFITGCSTGLGRALALRVLQHGHRCVVTARNTDQVKDIVARHSQSSLALALDVTNAAERDAAVAQAEKTFGQIDVLVNNAGYGYLAAIEEGEDEQIRAMFEANFFALAALTRRVLPGMRARKRGHVVNIASVGGLIGNPGSGYYCATKFAVVGLSEALSKEVGALGIRVTSVEPGPFRTDWAGRSLRQTRQSIADYAATSGARRAQVAANSGKQAGDPDRAADAIIHVVESENPPLHLVLGSNAYGRMRDKLAEMSKTLDDYEALTVGTDYPEP